MQKSVKQVVINRINGQEGHLDIDQLAVEEPLEIRLEFGENGQRTTRNVSVTMRTPGNDEELALGFLFTEGIIKGHDAVSEVISYPIVCAESKENIITISLREEIVPFLQSSERNFYTTSSCGVCGKGSINAIRTVGSFQSSLTELSVEAALLYSLPAILRSHQDVFESTGGLHASALFDSDGALLLLREDVGRHNALDKLIGAAFTAGLLPLEKHILLLSGRASFELIQKAAMAGIGVIAAVGAPSSLAVELATEFGITLAGFLRDKRFNIYTSPQRIVLPAHENTH